MRASEFDRSFGEEVDKRLLAAVDDVAASAPADGALADLFDRLRDLVAAGGKRLRPTFCLWGYRACGGDDDAIVDAASALELVHMCALIHDDVMDATPLRRGRPTIHTVLADDHRDRGWLGDPGHFGTSGAIMAGDLALVVADVVFSESAFPLERLADARREFDAMRIEVTLGQYLDLVEGYRRSASVDSALTVAALKTSKYTVSRPLLVGAALGAAGDDVRAALAAYGEPLGLAFQLRDDLLGAFGDADLTGKPVGLDFREAKQTFLLASARSAGTDDQVGALDRNIGRADLDDAGVAEIRAILRDTGAVAASEARIRDLVDDALGALEAAPIAETARAALTALADRVAYRDS